MKNSKGTAIPAGENPPQNYLLLAATSVRDIYETSLLLQRFGYSVCAAQSGTQAIDMISLSRPSLVITDLSLPDMTGLELLRRISSDASNFPLIVLVPDGNQCVEARNFELGGAIPFLVKPVAAESLYRAVQAAIEPTPRSTIRIRTSLPVVVNNTLLDCSRGECATHLSSQGMYVRMRKPHRPNGRLKITVNIGDRAVTAEAAVLYTRKFRDGLSADPGMAVKFTDIKPEDQALIASYIHREITRGVRTTES